METCGSSCGISSDNSSDISFSISCPKDSSAGLFSSIIWSMLLFSLDNFSISLVRMSLTFWNNLAAFSSFSGIFCIYSCSNNSFGDRPAFNWGITSTKRSMISSASWSALAFADSNRRCSASCNAASAARFVFSHSSSTSWMLIWPVICLSTIGSFGTYRLICPSESSANISLKLIFKEPSISSSVSICPYFSSFCSSLSCGSCK